MRLISLYIKEYKNLKNITINFKDGDTFSVLIGTNGSGKSNIIEVVSKIFYDCFYVFTSGLEYELLFESKSEVTGIVSTVKIVKKANANLSLLRNRSDLNAENEWISISRIEWNKYLPHNIVALYCGDDNKLWEETYKGAYNRYRRGVYNRTTNTRNNMIYVNKYYWKIALIAQLLQNDEIELNQKYFGIDGIHKVTFLFAKDYKLENPNLIAFLEILNPEKFECLEIEWAVFKELMTRSGYSVDTISEFLVQLFMPKDKKIIKEIHIETTSNYNFDSLSEGIKRIILIRYVVSVCALRNSLILMDEPDSHIAENKKKDILQMITEIEKEFAIQFLVSSHSPTFVDVVSSNHIVALKSDELGNVEIINDERMDLINYLTGNKMQLFTKKAVIYCEGGENSLDKGLLEILFPDKIIVATGSCEDVISKTKLHNTEYPDLAIGIIDADYHNNDRKTGLEEKRIYMLPVLEIENVLMDFAIVDATKHTVHATDNDVDAFKEYFFSIIDTDKNNQSAKHTSNTFINEIKMSLQAENRDLNAFKTKVGEIIDTEKIDSLYSERITQIENNLLDKDYEELVKRIDLNHSIDRFFSRNLMPHFSQRVLKIIASNPELQDILRQKYYGFIE